MKRIQQLIAGLILFAVFFANSSQISAQCDVSANGFPETICAGEQVVLTSTGGCGYLMANDFNDGTPGAGWTATTGVDFTNNCGPGPDLIYLWMGQNVPIPRTLTTVNFDVDGACEISFWMRFEVQTGSPGNCEGPDLADEGMSLQYSINAGVSWTDIVYFRPDGVMCASYPNSSGFIAPSGATAFTTWTQYTFAVPPPAQTPNTQFRWRQHVYTSQTYDHWGIDMVEILCPSGTAVEWSHGPTVFNPPPVFPDHDTCYIVTVTDTLYGTGFATDTVCITVNQVPTATFNVESPICSDLSSTINYTGTSGSGATYNWFFSGGQVLSGSGSGPYELTWPSSGWQYISLEVYENGCTSGPQYDSVLVHLAPSVVFTGTPTSGCMPLTVSFSDYTSPTGSNWYWAFGDGGVSNDQNPVHVYNTPGAYNVNLIVVTAEGCDDTLTKPAYITVYGQPSADFTWSPEIGKIYDPVITFYADDEYATSFYWDFGDATNSTDFPPVVHTYPPVEANYTVTLIVTNEHGCSDTITHTVQIIDDILIFPNIITPGNSDGYNDLFVIVNGDKYPGNTLAVFNRWGKKVYEKTDYMNDWDGGDLAEGTYYYIFTYMDKEYHGSLTILRD